MGKGVKPTLIGLFVLGGVALGLTAIVALGSGHFLSRTTQFVCYFSSDVTGLSVGAPVRFHGVHVGSVTKILLALNPPGPSGQAEQGEIRIPVVIELDLGRIVELGGPVDLGNPATLRRLINQGLRAQLATESLVTGVRYVALDFNPNHPAHFYGPRNSKYLEIPTIPTTLQQAQSTAERLLKRLENVDLEHLVTSLTSTVNSLNQLLASHELTDTLVALRKATQNLNQTALSVRQLANHIDSEIKPLQKNLLDVSNNTNAALKTVQITLSPDSPLIYRFNEAMNQVAAAAAATRELADYLERNPAALLRGREAASEDR